MVIVAAIIVWWDLNQLINVIPARRRQEVPAWCYAVPLLSWSACGVWMNEWMNEWPLPLLTPSASFLSVFFVIGPCFPAAAGYWLPVTPVTDRWTVRQTGVSGQRTNGLGASPVWRRVGRGELRRITEKVLAIDLPPALGRREARARAADCC